MTVHKFKLYAGKDPRDLPAYSLKDASRYVDVPLNTLRSWIRGRSYPTEKGRQFWQPIIQRPSARETALSFTNLIEAHVLSAMRRIHNVQMVTVRKALDYLSKQFDSIHPLAEHDFETDGLDLFVAKYGQLINVSKGGQIAMKEILEIYLKRIERDENGLARQLFPFTRLSTSQHRDDPKIVAINPLVAFGRPVISGTGIPTTIVAERYKTGESIREIADDYQRTTVEIEEAIRCEFEVKAA
ncbi:MAG: DUF433 domain-containing protein [Acidobacteria bacterium]|nr:DUF433 domain-containing protein [Acidobacteriota bacterium]